LSYTKKLLLSIKLVQETRNVIEKVIGLDKRYLSTKTFKIMPNQTIILHQA